MAQLLSTNKASKEGFHVLQTQLNSGFHKKNWCPFKIANILFFSAGNSKPFLT